MNVLEVPPAPLEHSGKSVPTSAEKSEPQNYLQLAFRSRIKVFYRPSGLKGTANEAPASLSWKLHSDGRVLVSNPTPYHVTLTRTEALDEKGSKEVIDKAGVLLAPASNTHSSQHIRWTLIKVEKCVIYFHQRLRRDSHAEHRFGLNALIALIHNKKYYEQTGHITAEEGWHPSTQQRELRSRIGDRFKL